MDESRSCDRSETAPRLENRLASAGRLQDGCHAIQNVEQIRTIVLDFAEVRVLTGRAARGSDRAPQSVQEVRIMFHQQNFPRREVD